MIMQVIFHEIGAISRQKEQKRVKLNPLSGCPAHTQLRSVVTD